MLLEARQLDELRQRSDRVSSERPRPLGDLVHHVVEVFVLLLEELVKIVELRPDDVPVIVARLRVQDVLVGQQRTQQPTTPSRCFSSIPMLGFIV